MDLKNSARKKNEIYKRSVVYKGEFKNGNLDGDCNVIVTDKRLGGLDVETEVRSYKTLFQNGLELPQSKEIKDVNMDGLLINMLLCLLVLAGILIGASVDVRAFYPTGAIYVI
jgi:hypothetical protein